jgi:chromosome segregation ATPase
MTAGRRQALAIGAADKKRRDMQFDVDSNETHCAYIQNELRSHLDKRDMARNNLNVAKNDFNNVSVEVAKIFEEHKQLIDKAAKLTPIIHAASAIRHGMASKHHDAEAKLHEVEEALRRLTSLSIRKNKERDAAKERLAAAEREERQILARK